MAAKPNGTFCWADLMPADQPRAEAFYAGLAGWHTGPKHPDFDYAMQFLGNEEPQSRVAGISGGMDGVPPSWNAYLASDDFAATQTAVEAAGGSLAMESFEIPGSGIGGFFIDPTGATFGVWQSKGHDGFGPWGVHGSFTWLEVYTREARRAAEFYAEVFGLEAHPLAETDDFTYFQLKVPGTADPVFGVMQMGGSFPADARPHLMPYLRVDDADAASAKVAQLGGAVVREPWTSPYGRMGLVNDSEGALLALADPATRS